MILALNPDHRFGFVSMSNCQLDCRSHYLIDLPKCLMQLLTSLKVVNTCKDSVVAIFM